MNDKVKLGLTFFPAFDWKISDTHPERQERLLYTRDQLTEEGLLDHPAVREFRPHVATREEVEAVHVVAPSFDTWVTDAHRVSAGGAMAAADAVMTGRAERAFALVRPPGHHAMRMVHGIRGFCSINIEAVMIAHLRRTYGTHRIAVIDTDVHHGDGTQEIFYHDPDTLFISLHQDGRTLYPGTGFQDEFGGPQAIGSNINIPLPPGTGDEEIMKVLNEIVLPILADFKPDIVINSAGQDNHFSDPLADMRVTAKGYARLTDALKADIAVLEGGYSVEAALPYVNTAVVLAMAGLDYDKVIEPAADSEKLRSSAAVRKSVDGLLLDWQARWANRHAYAEAARTSESYKATKRSIYYDETGITEWQTERIRMRRDGLGWRSIRSTVAAGPFGRQDVQVVFIPRQASASCRSEGRDEALKIKRTGDVERVVVLDELSGIQERI